MSAEFRGRIPWFLKEQPEIESMSLEFRTILRDDGKRVEYPPLFDILYCEVGQ